MGATVTVLKVFIENDNVIVEAVSPIAGINVGDFVKLIINNQATVGEVKEVRQATFEELKEVIFNMKTVMGKVENPHEVKSLKKPGIENKFITNICYLVILEQDSIKPYKFFESETRSFNVEVGDTILFNADKKPHKGMILKMEVIDGTRLCSNHMIAVLKKYDRRLFRSNIIVDAEAGFAKASLVKWIKDEETVIIDGGMTHIETRAFDRCHKVKSVYIVADGITIEPMAFAHNKSIEEIIISGKNIDIAINAFEGCVALKHIKLRYYYQYIEEQLQEYYDRVEIVYELFDDIENDDFIYSKDGRELVCCLDKDIKGYIAPISVKSIGSYAFWNCKELKEMMLYPTVEKVQNHALAGCMNLKKVTAPISNDLECILLFDDKYCRNSREVELTKNNGDKISYYIPDKCIFEKSSELENFYKKLPIDIIDTNQLKDLADYCKKIGDIEYTIKLYTELEERGDKRGYRGLARMSQLNNTRQYFHLDAYEYYDRTDSIMPLINMLRVENQQLFEGMDERQIWGVLSTSDGLKQFLEFLTEVSLYDLKVFIIALDEIYNQTFNMQEVIHRYLFLKCSCRVFEKDEVFVWRDELLDEFAYDSKYQREFAFEIIGIDTRADKKEIHSFIEAVEDEETREMLSVAYNAAIAPDADNLNIFKEFIKKAKETEDAFYQKCAILAISSYVYYMFCEKKMATELKSFLEMVLEQYLDGIELMCIFMDSYKQKMRRNIPKKVFMESGESAIKYGYMNGELASGALNPDLRHDNAKVILKYPDFFDLEDPSNIVMEQINKMMLMIPGTEIEKSEKDEEDIPFIHFDPFLFNDQIIVFFEPHEGVSYMQNNGYPVPDRFYEISIDMLGSIMNRKSKSEAILFPRMLNKKITIDYIESLY